MKEKLKYIYKLSRRNFLFWLSRKIDYPLCPPDVVQVNFTFRCNLRCHMCHMQAQMEHLQSKGKQIEIDSDTFRKVIRESKEIGAQAVLFIGGEPLLRKDLFDLVKYCTSLKLGAVIVTNGVLLKGALLQKCLDAGVDWFSISIDAANEETFCKIRKQKVLHTIIDNVKQLNEEKKRQNREFPKMVSVCTIMNENLEEILDVIKLSRQLNIERVLLQPVVAENTDQTKRDQEAAGVIPPERLAVLDKTIDDLIQFKKFSPENFDFIGNSIKNLKLMKKYFRHGVHPRQAPCYAGYNRVQIVQEGGVYFCVSQEDYDANIGDVSKDSLKELWYSKEAKFYRKIIRKCKSPCLQWCSYRDDFIELTGIFQKAFLFNKFKKKK